MAKIVHIRPVTEAELDLLEVLFTDPGETTLYGFFGYQNPGQLRRDFAEPGFMTEDRGRLAVAVGAGDEAGEFIGAVSWFKVHTGPTSYSWNIGIGLLARARGRGTAPGRSDCSRSTCSPTRR